MVVASLMGGKGNGNRAGTGKRATNLPLMLVLAAAITVAPTATFARAPSGGTSGGFGGARSGSGTAGRSSGGSSSRGPTNNPNNNPNDGQNGGDNSGGWGGGNGGGWDQPKGEDPTITADKQAISDKQSELNVAQRELPDATKAFQAKYRRSSAYLDAKKALDDAIKAQGTARDSALAKLKSSNADYKSALTKEADAKTKLDTMRKNGASRDAISNQSKVILDTGDAVSKMEESALTVDAGYNSAKEKVAAAKRAVEAMDNKMNDAMKTDPDVLAAQKKVDGLTKAVADAQKKLETDTVAVNSAIAGGGKGGGAPPAPAAPVSTGGVAAPTTNTSTGAAAGGPSH